MKDILVWLRVEFGKVIRYVCCSDAIYPSYYGNGKLKVRMKLLENVTFMGLWMERL